MALFEQSVQSIPSNLLKDKYGWPPFSILDTKSWDWQRRKDEWERVLPDSTLGRDTRRYNATPTNTFSARGSGAKEPNSISAFDPYLTELMYRWFSRDGDLILDPFSGGCVRGEVARILGRKYIGIDLSLHQTTANIYARQELDDKYKDISGISAYMNGDSEKIIPQLADDLADMVFTCPPYYNLERYTYADGELSRLPTYEAFLDKYSRILKLTADKLKDDSFFVIVVSEVRADSQSIANSHYVGLVPDTIRILRDKCCLHYYNEIILVNNIGSLPIRTPKSFDRTRKVGRHHQNVLVFYKGQIQNIENKFGPL